MLDYFINNPTGMKVLLSVIVFFSIFILAKFVNNMIHKRIDDTKKYYQIKRTISYSSGFLMIICIVFVWIDSVGNLTTYIGLLSAGIAIALREVFINISGWIFIEFRKPFDVGHRISIGNQKGDVIDKRLFQFTLMEVSPYEDGEQSTGRIVDVPNSYVFLHPTINYTKGFEYIWNEIKVLITFESDWQKAKDLLLEIVKKDDRVVQENVTKQIRSASRKYMIHYNKLTPIVYTDVKESGVQLTLRYLCEPKQRRVSSNRIWESILGMIQENNSINLAYPTKRVTE